MALTALGVVFLLVAAFTSASFIRIFREQNGWPWASEVPLMCIAILVASGCYLIVWH